MPKNEGSLPSFDPTVDVFLQRRTQIPGDCTGCERAMVCTEVLNQAAHTLIDKTGVELHLPGGTAEFAMLSYDEAEACGALDKYWEYVDAQRDLALLVEACEGGMESFASGGQEFFCGLSADSEVADL